MKNILAVAVLVVGFSAFAQDAGAAAPAAASVDWSKTGPGARKPADEKKSKKEIEDFFKKMDAADKAHDMDAMVAAHDFPVYMVTDDTKGAVEAKAFSKE